jgi:hypothetical protein
MSSVDTKIILEHFDEKFAVLLENLETMIEKKVRPIVQKELAEVKDDIKAIQAAVEATHQSLIHPRAEGRQA